MTHSEDIFVSWAQYHHLIEVLAAKIYDSDWAFNQIICLARGGLRVGDILSRIYNQPLAVLSAASYEGKDFQQQGRLRVSNTLTMSESQLGDRILLVDDLVDSGVTLRATVDWLREHHHVQPDQCRTAVLWYKATSSIAPDYFVEQYSASPWIHQPFEDYENQDLEVLMTAFRQTGRMFEQP